MSDYPDPDEEYELMYADELEMLRDEDDHTGVKIPRPKSFPAKRSLDFSSPASKSKSRNDEQTLSQSIQPLPNSLDVDTPVDNTHIQNSHTHTEISTHTYLNTEDVYQHINGPNKRTVTDLFGDVNDIDFDDIELPSKRQKTDEENDYELIEKIIEGRNLKQILDEPLSKVLSAKPVYNAKDNMSLDIPRWAFIPLTNSDGDRIYIKLDSEDSWDKSLDTNAELSLNTMFTNTWEEARKLLEAKQQTPLESEPPVEIIHDTLWVDKYRPQSYVDLLSEEPVNRALLHWLHLWDKIVFKKEVKMKDPQQRTAFSKRMGQFQLSSKWRGKKEAEPEMDDDGRPHHKVALLCGPPGVGKTTLAHLLARLAGYRPVELNASDERSTESFRNALQSATLMRSVLDAERKPNCLILDEIDGAPLQTVELLVKWCTTTVESGKKNGKSHPLRRPVIAICNDLYAASLRPLRAVAEIVSVCGVSRARLSSRLARVAAAEGLRVPPHVCAALAQRVHGDVRAAIQVLSFINTKKQQLNMSDVENTAIGTKDCNKTMMQALQAVFTLNDHRPLDVLTTIQAAGDYDRLLDGIYENYLTARVDSRLQIATETLSYMMLHDVVQTWTLRNQNYSLYGMLPLCLYRCHLLLASRTTQRMRFPMQAQEMYRKKQEMDSITTSISIGSSPRVACSKRALLLDILPLLPHIIKVNLRSANVQLCSDSERRTLRTIAGALCDYGLQFTQQRTDEGVYAFLLDPDVYKVAFFGNEEKARPPPAIRQAISREQQLEMIRRNEEMTSRISNTNRSQVQTKRRSTETKALGSKDKDKDKDIPLPNHLQRLKPKEVDKTAPQVHKDFFGRIVPIAQAQRTDGLPDVISSSNVFYQYREGFNNAVRRNVRTKDML